ncbi:MULTISPECIES: sugar ABC transporter substrate-binding protein [Ignavibacterium]|jgi:multiple sugar transport system substrate-binding protein|uniref:sugar ABC transporter substrate-binding protein n=1 Tax=Ignavibacterium TaxID=795750 RepID=UPI0025C209AD|nr:MULTISPECIES: sugar ABC transporter substrate-binding protein [Ignavibacterium]MBI5662118.1 sugar ABC transporter substrate-binding protein [Ignavibacterium album]
MTFIHKKIFRTTLLIIIISLYACKSVQEENVTIKFWAMGSEAEQISKILPEFEKKYPNIKVKVQQIPWTAAQEKLITAFASDNTPDVCQLGNTWIPQFASLNAIIDLSDFIARSSTVKAENFFSGIWETNIIDNRVFGIPWYVDTRLMFYRKDVFERAGFNNPPKNWDELYLLCKKIKELNKGKEKYPIFIPTNEWNSFIIFGLQAGAKLLKEKDTRGNFSSKEFKEAFDYLIRFHKEKLTPFGMMQVTNVYQAMADEYISIYFSGPWNIPEFKKWMTGNLADKWATAPMPGYRDEYPGLSLAGGSSLVIFKNSKHKNEVWKLIEFLSEPEIQLKVYRVTNNLPSVIEAWNDSSLANDIYMKAFYQQLQRVTSAPKIPEWEQIVFSKLQQYAEFAARGVMTTEEALKKLDEDADRILEKRRWLTFKQNK